MAWYLGDRPEHTGDRDRALPQLTERNVSRPFAAARLEQGGRPRASLTKIKSVAWAIPCQLPIIAITYEASSDADADASMRPLPYSHRRTARRATRAPSHPQPGTQHPAPREKSRRTTRPAVQPLSSRCRPLAAVRRLPREERWRSSAPPAEKTDKTEKGAKGRRLDAKLIGHGITRHYSLRSHDRRIGERARGT